MTIALGEQVVSVGFCVSWCDRRHALRPGCSLWRKAGKAAGILRIEGDSFGREIRAKVQRLPAWAAISVHMTPPCYRFSWIIGAVFSEIAPATLPIILLISILC